jgi:hypothetical protein
MTALTRRHVLAGAAATVAAAALPAVAVAEVVRSTVSPGLNGNVFFVPKGFGEFRGYRAIQTTFDIFDATATGYHPRSVRS